MNKIYQVSIVGQYPEDGYDFGFYSSKEVAEEMADSYNKLVSQFCDCNSEDDYECDCDGAIVSEEIVDEKPNVIAKMPFFCELYLTGNYKGNTNILEAESSDIEFVPKSQNIKIVNYEHCYPEVTVISYNSPEEAENIAKALYDVYQMFELNNAEDKMKKFQDAIDDFHWEYNIRHCYNQKLTNEPMGKFNFNGSDLSKMVIHIDPANGESVGYKQLMKWVTEND